MKYAWASLRELWVGVKEKLKETEEEQGNCP